MGVGGGVHGNLPTPQPPTSLATVSPTAQGPRLEAGVEEAELLRGTPSSQGPPMPWAMPGSSAEPDGEKSAGRPQCRQQVQRAGLGGAGAGQAAGAGGREGRQARAGTGRKLGNPQPRPRSTCVSAPGKLLASRSYGNSSNSHRTLTPLMG